MRAAMAANSNMTEKQTTALWKAPVTAKYVAGLVDGWMTTREPISNN